MTLNHEEDKELVGHMIQHVVLFLPGNASLYVIVLY